MSFLWFRSKKAVRDARFGNGSKSWQHQRGEGGRRRQEGEMTWPGTGKGAAVQRR